VRASDLLALGLLLVLAGPPMARARPEEPPLPGQTAPGFALPDLQGRRVALEDFRGRVTLVNFWACWCDTWKDEVARLKQLRACHPELPFEVLFVTVDARERSLVEPLLLNQGVLFPVLVDPRGTVSRLYGVSTVPTLYLLDAQGVVRFVHQGYPGNRLLAEELRLCGSPWPRSPSLDQESLQAEFLLPEERRLLRLVNQERARRGLTPLRLDATLTEVGREYLQRMLVGDFFSHHGPERPDVRLRARGVRYARMGEDLAQAGDAPGALAALMASPGHKANLLHPRYHRVGVAALRAGPQGWLFCLLFVEEPP
jgi:uncharacterized protein YkwD